MSAPVDCSNSYRLKIGVKQKTVVDNCETTQIFLSTLETKWHLRPCPKEMLDYPAIHAPYYFSMVKGHEEEHFEGHLKKKQEVKKVATEKVT